ncbi:MAG: hypothetical protein ABIF12_03425 [bacterium]
MKKIIIILFSILLTSQLYGGSGKVTFENTLNQKIEIKFITADNKEYFKIIEPNNIWITELSQTFGTPDISKMWVKFPPGTSINLGSYKAKEQDLDYRTWKEKIDIRNNKITKVKISYNKEKNRFERQISIDGKIIEDNLQNPGTPVEAELILKNESNFNLSVNLMLLGEEWQTIILNAKSMFKIRVGRTNIQTRNLDHMTVEFATPQNLQKSIEPDKRWWPNTIRNKKKQRTIIVINYDDLNKRFTRTAYRKDKAREKLDVNIGIKFSGSYKDLPVRPIGRQLDIINKIANLEAQIIKLNTEKAVIKITKQTTMWLLEKIKFSAIGFSKFAKKAAEGLLRLLNIKKANWSGSIKEIVNGKLPLFHMEYEIIGSPRTMNIQFDFKNPQNTFKEMGDNINSGIKERMQKALEEETQEIDEEVIEK